MASHRSTPALIAGALLVCLTAAPSLLHAQSASPSVVTGTCKDGSKTSAAHRQGACRGHGGIATWASTAGTGTDTVAAATTAAVASAATPKARTAATTTPKASAASPAPAAAASTTVPATTAAAGGAAPAGATGLCKDGSYTKAIHHSGACAHHGGVKSWLQPTQS